MYPVRRRHALAACVIALVALVAAGCSKPEPRANDGFRVPTPPPVTTWASPTMAPSPTPSPLPLVEPTRVEPTQLDGLPPMAFRPGSRPLSRNLNESVNVEAYILDIMRSVRERWSGVLTQAQLQAPPFTFDATSRSDRYVSTCLKSGQQITLTSGSSYLLYCWSDDQPDGAVAIPTGALQPLWKMGPRRVSDMAAAISVSRQASLIVIASLERQLGMPALSDINRQYVAACFSGVWIQSVYGRNIPRDDAATALRRSLRIPSQVDGTLTQIQPTDQQIVKAWTTGSQSGWTNTCAAFWQ